MMTDKDDVHAPLRRAVKHSLDYLDSLDTRDVTTSKGLDDLRRDLGGALGEEPAPAETVIDELAEAVDGGLFPTGGGRFFAWAIGGALPVAVAADWLTSAWDQNTVILGTSPAMNAIEEVAGGWLKDVLRLPADASFALVTGCQVAHVTALAAARHELLRKRGHDVEAKGLMGAPRIRIHTGELCHESIQRAARLVGLGTDAVEAHPCHEDGTIDIDHVARRLEADGDDTPAVLVLQAGEFNTGAFDDYHRANALRRKHGIWVHVDGALGLWAAASERYRHLMDGCELMDSWATDGHKWLNLPFDSGFVFTAHPDAHKKAMTMRASYFTASDDVRHSIDWTPEWSRRGRAVPLYAALRALGRRGLQELIDRCCALTERLVVGIGSLEGAEVVARPVINQGLVRFLGPGGDHDGRTDAVVARLQQSGVAWFGSADFKGRRVMRTPVLSFRTTERDIDRAIEAVRVALAS